MINKKEIAYCSLIMLLMSVIAISFQVLKKLNTSVSFIEYLSINRKQILFIAIPIALIISAAVIVHGVIKFKKEHNSKVLLLDLMIALIIVFCVFYIARGYITAAMLAGTL